LGKLHRDVLARHRGLLLTEDDLARVGPCVRSEEATIPPLPRGEGRGEGAWGAAGAGESTLTRPPLAGDLSPRERRAAPDGRPDSQAGLLERSFGRPGAPLEVEIGPGKDDFVVREAKARPETNFLAVERLRERVDALCGKIRRARVSNVRVFYGEAGAALSRLVRPGSVRAFYVHFPDPWPKRRHGKHRLIQPAFAAQVAERLIPGGRLTVITDDRPYAEQVLECLDATPGLANIAGKGHWATELPGYHQSVYEKKRRAAGCVIYYMRFAKA
ncbi:MAG: tRNA (guanosine(46)-N7)-methyltransferase TrmB, partial [Planctomycetes bacterium]|nr:tRNA (guanosine(46)-N7)-methyltransferase TrmB [Planctomycetota bacterium]